MTSGKPSSSLLPIGSLDHVVIVGGGISGLAAAVDLTSRGYPVILLEQKASLGGRAYSFTDNKTGDVIDNGQHVLIAGYHRTLAFLEKIGTRNLLSIQGSPSYLLHHPRKGLCKIWFLPLPAPLHLLIGVLASRLFSWSDKIRMCRAGKEIFRMSEDDLRKKRKLTVELWLDSVGQSSETKQSFWEPLAVSIMNENISQAAAEPFIRSVRHAFIGARRNAALALPNVGLSDLYVNGAVGFIVKNGGQIFTRADVVRVESEGNVVKSVRLRNDRQIKCGALILSIPYDRIPPLLPEKFLNYECFTKMRPVRGTPIVSIHLWFENEIEIEEVIGLIGRRIQWIFNRRKINREKGKGGHLSLVISAAREFVDLANEKLIAMAMEDLREVIPTPAMSPAHAVVIREKRATFSSSPANELLRPGQATPVPNLFLAGDWTNTGLPATIEGAVISAERAAELARRWLEKK